MASNGLPRVSFGQILPPGHLLLLVSERRATLTNIICYLFIQNPVHIPLHSLLDVLPGVVIEDEETGPDDDEENPVGGGQGQVKKE